MEVVIAVAITALLAALTIPTLSRYVEQSNIDHTAETMGDVTLGIALFRTKTSSSTGTLTYAIPMRGC